MNSMVSILIGVVIVVLLVGRRMMGTPLTQRRLTVLPLVITVFGVYSLANAHITPHPIDVVFLAIDAVVAIGLGFARGTTINVYVQNEHLWMKYRVVTVVLWIASIAVRFGVEALGGVAGASTKLLTAALVMMLGLTFLSEAGIVWLKAMKLNAPFAPRTSRRTTMRV